MYSHLRRCAFAATAVVIGLLGTAACSSSTQAGNAAPSASTPAPAPSPTAAVTTGNKSAQNGTYAWTVTKVDYAPTVTAKDGEVVKPDDPSTTRLCLMTMTVKNVSKEDQSYADIFDRALDASGKKYGKDGFLLDSQHLTQDLIKPGDTITIQQIFLVPNDVTVTAVKVAAEAGGEGGIDIKLS
jgi:hypothetical protein